MVTSQVSKRSFKKDNDLQLQIFLEIRKKEVVRVCKDEKTNTNKYNRFQSGIVQLIPNGTWLFQNLTPRIS